MLIWIWFCQAGKTDKECKRIFSEVKIAKIPMAKEQALFLLKKNKKEEKYFKT